MEARNPEHHHHHHHHHGRREEAQSALSMQMLKRHHSHHHHHHHDREVQEAVLDKRAHDHDHDHDSGHDHDHDHSKRATTHVYLSPANAVVSDTWDPLDPVIGIGNTQIGDGRDGSYSDDHYLLGDGSFLKREPSPHHHHVDHDKIVMTGDNDHVHMHGKREPHHHHHHGDKIVMTGDNDDVHIHERNVRNYIPEDSVMSVGLSLDVGSGDDCEVVHGRYMKCRDDQKRSILKRDDAGVPGTVDIVVSLFSSLAVSTY